MLHWVPVTQRMWFKIAISAFDCVREHCTAYFNNVCIPVAGISIRLYTILPVFLYGAETWSITKAIEKRIDAFDQWCLRRILNVTWSECVTNFEVRRRTAQPLLSDTVRIRRLKLFGHVARADKSQDHSRALQACISPAPRNWRWRPGRPRQPG